MTSIGFHASHEQFSPRDLLNLVQLAEKNGFQSAMSSDHLSPWSHDQGESGNGWSWLGAALQATDSLSFGSLAIPGGWRFHPVMLAHAAATLAQMFPQRLAWLAAGSGEALNEAVVSPHWPEKRERNERLQEGVEIMRALWKGETVTRKTGYHYTDNAKIWSLPENAPKIFGAALSSETAEWMGSWADGLVTVNQPEKDLKLVLDAFDRGGGSEKPRYVQVHISWAGSLQLAQDNAFEQWRNNTLSSEECANLRTVAEFEAASKHVTLEDIEQSVFISIEPDEHIAYLSRLGELGFETIYVHNVGRNQAEFIQDYGSKILPALKGG